MTAFKKIYTIVLLTFSLWAVLPATANAQIIFGTENDANNNAGNRMGPPGFDDNVSEEAPINSLIVLGLLVGVYLGYRRLNSAEV